MTQPHLGNQEVGLFGAELIPVTLSIVSVASNTLIAGETVIKLKIKNL